MPASAPTSGVDLVALQMGLAMGLPICAHHRRRRRGRLHYGGGNGVVVVFLWLCTSTD